MRTIRRARKVHTCAHCGGNIQKGEKHLHVQTRTARENKEGEQIGIEFHSYRTHSRHCMGELIGVADPANVMKNCRKGIHSPTYDADPDNPLDGIWCEWCGTALKSMENPVAM